MRDARCELARGETGKSPPLSEAEQHSRRDIKTTQGPLLLLLLLLLLRSEAAKSEETEDTDTGTRFHSR
jgi:hypothetical protein